VTTGQKFLLNLIGFRKHLGKILPYSTRALRKYTMKSEFKAKFLQHLLQKKEDQGFTLIELLVVIIIIGILSAIALPSFLNQANKARESEAKQYVGSMNRAQQAYYLENQKFSTTFDDLGLGIQTQTTNYTYSIAVAAASGTIGTKAAWNRGLPLNTEILRSYVGGVDVVQSGGAATTLAILCAKTTAGTAAFGVGSTPATIDTNTNNTVAPTCGASFETLD
jgi:prepilin-type N-terminal cleavage/methylation domain-containing protein